MIHQEPAAKSAAQAGHLSNILKVPVLVQDPGPLPILLPCLPICLTSALLLRVQHEYLQRAQTPCRDISRAHVLEQAQEVLSVCFSTDGDETKVPEAST